MFTTTTDMTSKPSCGFAHFFRRSYKNALVVRSLGWFRAVYPLNVTQIRYRSGARFVDIARLKAINNISSFQIRMRNTFTATIFNDTSNLSYVSLFYLVVVKNTILQHGQRGQTEIKYLNCSEN